MKKKNIRTNELQVASMLLDHKVVWLISWLYDVMRNKNDDGISYYTNTIRNDMMIHNLPGMLNAMLWKRALLPVRFLS